MGYNELKKRRFLLDKQYDQQCNLNMNIRQNSCKVIYILCTMTLFAFVSLNGNECKYVHLKRERENMSIIVWNIPWAITRMETDAVFLVGKSNIFHVDAYTLIEWVTKERLTQIWRSKLASQYFNICKSRYKIIIINMLMWKRTYSSEIIFISSYIIIDISSFINYSHSRTLNEVAQNTVH